jgi:hypothetical protein
MGLPEEAVQHAVSLALLLACRIGTPQVGTARLDGVVQDPSSSICRGEKSRSS